MVSIIQKDFLRPECNVCQGSDKISYILNSLTMLVIYNEYAVSLYCSPRHIKQVTKICENIFFKSIQNIRKDLGYKYV